MQVKMSLSDQETRNARLNKRLEDIGWGLFLMLIGVIWLVPETQLPQGVWLIGVAIVLLGLNWVRYLNGIKMSGFTIILGLLALAAGLGGLLGVKLPIFAVLLILIGASIILKPLFEGKN
ncbi:MAG TPA: hypothetical protein VLM38_17275 [Blastocatellia bacterium]|nr:hypothetical protein [Blastocatellia bacterium]